MGSQMLMLNRANESTIQIVLLTIMNGYKLNNKVGMVDSIMV